MDIGERMYDEERKKESILKKGRILKKERILKKGWILEKGRILKKEWILGNWILKKG